MATMRDRPYTQFNFLVDLGDGNTEGPRAGFQEMSDVQRLRQLFDSLDRKRDLLNLFDQCLSAPGMQIFIGDESGYRVLDECSVVTAPYFVDGQVAGVLGVIGPTRMAYHRIIPLVSETARLLTQGLKAEN